MSEVRVSRIGFVQAALRSRAVEAPRELRELAPSPGTRRTTVQEREVVKARATARPSRPLSCFLRPPALVPWPWQWSSGRLGGGQPAPSSASALVVGRLTLS